MFKPIAAAGLSLALLTGCLTTQQGADPGADEARLVRDAQRVVETIRANPDFSAINRYLADAVAVVVLPDMVKGGFIFGAEGGNGVLLARRRGVWSDPTFVTAGGGSVGLQIGGQVQDVVMIVRSAGALDAILDDRLRLGAEASVAAGPVGGGVEGATTSNLDADVLIFADAIGAFAGAALEGAVVAPRAARNEDYYGEPRAPRTVLETAADARSTGLRAALN